LPGALVRIDHGIYVGDPGREMAPRTVQCDAQRQRAPAARRHSSGNGAQGIITITYTPVESGGATGRIIRLIGGIHLFGGVRLE
jgi:hypothetical protein